LKKDERYNFTGQSEKDELAELKKQRKELEAELANKES